MINLLVLLKLKGMRKFIEIKKYFINKKPSKCSNVLTLSAKVLSSYYTSFLIHFCCTTRMKFRFGCCYQMGPIKVYAIIRHMCAIYIMV